MRGTQPNALDALPRWLPASPSDDLCRHIARRQMRWVLLVIVAAAAITARRVALCTAATPRPSGQTPSMSTPRYTRGPGREGHRLASRRPGRRRRAGRQRPGPHLSDSVTAESRQLVGSSTSIHYSMGKIVVAIRNLVTTTAHAARLLSENHDGRSYVSICNYLAGQFAGRS